MLGHDRKSFLREVSDAVARTEASIVSVSMNSQDSFILGHMVIEVANLFHLTRIINQISKVNGVINVERLDGTGEPVADLAGVSPAMV
jgi:(p)ppGpp synthase/HD superfamily hydrolase